MKTDFNLFDFEYEFDDKAFANQIEQAVIDAYYTSEIGQETPDDFKRVFKRRWLQAMSYYNKLHNTTLLEYNPLINYKMSEALEQLSTSSRKQQTSRDLEHTANVNGVTSEQIESESNDLTSENSSSNNTRTDNLKKTTNASDTTSDYPQQSIGAGDFLSGQRLSDSQTDNTGTVKDQSSSDNATTSESRGTSTSNTTNSQDTLDNTSDRGTLSDDGVNNVEYEKTIEGLTGKTYQELIQLERNNLMRITGMVVEEMKPCFILVY